MERTRFGNKPIFNDCTHWYNDACKWWLRLKHAIYGTELKNIVERFIQQQVKDRTECFDDYFPWQNSQVRPTQHMLLTALAKDISLISAYENR